MLKHQQVKQQHVRAGWKSEVVFFTSYHTNRHYVAQMDLLHAVWSKKKHNNFLGLLSRSLCLPINCSPKGKVNFLFEYSMSFLSLSLSSSLDDQNQTRYHSLAKNCIPGFNYVVPLFMCRKGLSLTQNRHSLSFFT